MAPADYEEIQVSRRQFFNRSIITTMAISIGAFGAAAISFLYAKSAGGFGGKVDAGISLAGAQAYWDANKAPYYVPEARTYLQPYPVQDVPKAKKVPEYALGDPRHGAGHRRAVPEVRAPGLPRAVVPDLAVVRVPVPRLEVQPGRREEGWPGAAWPRPLRRSPSPARR